MSGNAKKTYDAAEGGHVELPTQLSTYRYVGNSIHQINSLLRQVRRPGGTKLIFQTLPKHMRRRAMSHNPKRLPRKYHNAHKSQMAKSGIPVKKKRPTRKYRRRASNLVAEYMSRQRKFKWLETHVWHARRFHMINRWGFRLPFASCDKTFRACYRASAKHCLLQDISYMMCVELRAPLDKLKKGFARLTSTKCDLSISAITYLVGKREGSINLFRRDQYPYGAIGRGYFLWKPQSRKRASKARVLWLWLHPSVYAVVLLELISVFDLKPSKAVTTGSSITEVQQQHNTATDEPPPKMIKLQSEAEDQKAIDKDITVTKSKAHPMPLNTKSIGPLVSNIFIYSNEDEDIMMMELKGQLNRFRLTGPLANAVITSAFKPRKIELAELMEPSKVPKYTNWFEDLKEKSPSFINIVSHQTSNWDRLANTECPGEILSNAVMACNILDPRVHRPEKRTKAKPRNRCELDDSDSDDCNDEDGLSVLSFSVLWEEDFRERIKDKWIPTAELNKRRAQHAVVPGKKCSFEDELQPIPILLIQCPGTSGRLIQNGYGSGWDIIAPARCGMALWLALVMNGARVGGLRDFYSVARESGLEEHWPDTLAGQMLAGEHYNELRERYFRLPPNKRCNYRKLSVVSPFRAPFRQLLRDWQPEKSLEDFKSFYVLRDREALQTLNTCLREKISKFPQIMNAPNDLDYLVQVRLRMKTRGNPKEFALICLPESCDFRKHNRNRHLGNNDPIFVEDPLPDSNEQERKQLREQHKTMLKRNRAQRVRAKRRLQAKASTRVVIAPANTARLVKQYEEKMRELYLPEDANDFSTMYSVRKQCQREVIGYVTSANFSNAQGVVTAIGYVTKSSLKRLMTVCNEQKFHQLLCLVRDSKSRNYRFAMIGVNLCT